MSQNAISLPAATRMGPVTLAVSALGRAVDFYTRVLGLALLSQEKDGGQGAHAVLGAGSHALLHLIELPGARPQPRFSIGLYHVAILVPSRADLGRVLLNLARTEYPLQGFADHLVSEAIYLADPDGNGLEVYRDRPRADWRWRGDQVAMATDPLDVDAIIASVPDPQARFAGVPEATAVGHVHLKVGDIRQAEAFYRGVLGFDATAQLPGALFVSAGRYHHHLGLNTWESRGATQPPPDSAGLREYTIVVPDSQAQAEAAARLKTAGTAVEQRGADVLTADPWGNRIRLSVESNSTPGDRPVPGE